MTFGACRELNCRKMASPERLTQSGLLSTQQFSCHSLHANRGAAVSRSTAQAGPTHTPSNCLSCATLERLTGTKGSGKPSIRSTNCSLRLLDTMRPLQAFDAGGRARALSAAVQTLAMAKEAGIDTDQAMKLVDWQSE